jgi:hypothetical protein
VPFVYLSLDVIRCPEVYTMGQADIVGTRGKQSFINPFIAEVTLASYALDFVKSYRPVGTCLETGLTARAYLFVKDYDSVAPFHNGVSGTYLRTGGIVTVPAYPDSKYKFKSATRYFGTVLRHADQLHAFRGVKLLFAGNLTGLATPAGRFVDDQCVLIHDASCPPCSG